MCNPLYTPQSRHQFKDAEVKAIVTIALNFALHSLQDILRNTKIKRVVMELGDMLGGVSYFGQLRSQAG